MSLFYFISNVQLKFISDLWKVIILEYIIVYLNNWGQLVFLILELDKYFKIFYKYQNKVIPGKRFF